MVKFKCYAYLCTTVNKRYVGVVAGVTQMDMLQYPKSILFMVKPIKM